MSAISDTMRALIARDAKLSELIDAALADGWVLSVRLSPNVPGNDAHSLTAHVNGVETGEARVESVKL